MGNNSKKKVLYAIICITAVIGIGYMTNDYWYPAIIENCRECGLKYVPEDGPNPSSNPTPSPDVTFLPHQHPPPPYTETVPPTEMPTLTPN